MILYIVIGNMVFNIIYIAVFANAAIVERRIVNAGVSFDSPKQFDDFILGCNFDNPGKVGVEQAFRLKIFSNKKITPFIARTHLCFQLTNLGVVKISEFHEFFVFLF